MLVLLLAQHLAEAEARAGQNGLGPNQPPLRPGQVVVDAIHDLVVFGSHPISSGGHRRSPGLEEQAAGLVPCAFHEPGRARRFLVTQDGPAISDELSDGTPQKGSADTMAVTSIPSTERARPGWPAPRDAQQQ